MMLVGALAVISTQNSTVNSLAVICQGNGKDEYDAEDLFKDKQT